MPEPAQLSAQGKALFQVTLSKLTLCLLSHCGVLPLLNESIEDVVYRTAMSDSIGGLEGSFKEGSSREGWAAQLTL